MNGPLFELNRPDGGGGQIRPLNDPRPIESSPLPIEPSPIVHQTSNLGSGAPAAGGGSKIRTFEQKLGARHDENWNRTPNTTGTGAIHVKSFHCKLTGDSLSFLDEQINEWLDAHPEYEVKLVTTSVGEWTGKLKEPNLIVNVWV
jgi:hypothetical protein